MSLAAMIAKQKAAMESKANESSKPDADNSVAAVAPESPAPAATPAAGKLKFGIKKQGESNATGGAKVPAPSQAADNPVTRPAPVAADPVAAGGKLTLDDLENTTVEGIETGKEVSRGQFMFDDEIPSTAPTRDLPAELTEMQLAFVKSLDSIYEIVHDPELFGQMIRTIMQEMQENPDYVQLVADQDVHTMIRGLRQSMGLAKIKKAEKSTKTRAGAKKTVTPTAMAGTADGMFNADDW